MLVLRRGPQQRIQIGEDIVITVLQVKGRSVRIGIEAPADVHILRAELSDEADEPLEVRLEPVARPTASRSTATVAARTTERRHSGTPARPSRNRLARWMGVSSSQPPR